MIALDWWIVGLYMAGTLALGVWLARRASGGLVDFFVSGRSLPWWLAMHLPRCSGQGWASPRACSRATPRTRSSWGVLPDLRRSAHL